MEAMNNSELHVDVEEVPRSLIDRRAEMFMSIHWQISWQPSSYAVLHHETSNDFIRILNSSYPVLLGPWYCNKSGVIWIFSHINHSLGNTPYCDVLSLQQQTVSVTL